ncbi:AAA domain-containing protein [Butyrivibrio sp. XPD2002]|uniref:AAA domain-containing protein n=1 Tax=Butyrivibrio sp. XPD2002 TaxID=1280665 RepID=UPI0004037EDA|nr:AAA domain-containing protein [Butyrivibrio sp. XPD2002]
MKSFSDCPFKVSLPKISKIEKTVNLKFDIISKPGISSTVVVDEVELADGLGNNYAFSVTGATKEDSKLRRAVELAMELNGSGSFVQKNADIMIGFLANKGKKYKVSYKINGDYSVVLDDVSSFGMSGEDTSKYNEELEAEDSWEDETEDDEDDQYERSDSSGAGDYVNNNPTMLEYKNALFREKYYLQEDGGRKYKVTNGRFISGKNGINTYSFEMEAELHLPDDAPVTLTVGATTATGSVLVCESFQIVINIDKDFGVSINQAYIGVEPWKLLEALANKLDRLSRTDKLAMKLIEDGPGLASSQPISIVPKGQDKAIDAALGNDITVIWGPPGTGKTYTMAQIALNAIFDGKRVLVVSHSNVSVDGIVKQTVRQITTNGKQSYLRDGQILRYGYVRDEELSRDTYAVAYNYALNHKPKLLKESGDLYKEREHLRRSGAYNSERGAEIEKRLKAIRKEVREDEKKYVAKAAFVATTISKVTVDKVFEDAKYDVVMFDEVSMAYVPQIVCAAMSAKEKLVLVGDFRQLQPIAQSPAQKTLCTDIFAFLGIAVQGRMYAHPWMVMLNEQRRMYPEISAFPNKFVYSNLLKDHYSVITNNEDTVSREPFYDHSTNMIDLLGTYCACMKNSDNSRFNIVSAIISFLTALNGEEDGQKYVGIITPYSAQTRLIRAMIQDHRESDITDIACSTVHQFQGSERDVIIFDAVESYPSTKAGYLMSKDMDSVTRLVNVAVTRARGKLVVVANTKFWERRFEGTQHIFYKLIQFLKDKSNITSTHQKKLQKYIMQLPETKKIKNYQNLDDAIKVFSEDVAKAQEKIVISIPDGELDPKTHEQIFSVIAEAKRNGIRILCKTNGYDDLPDQWKTIAFATENAAFPIIMIDDKTMWYGLPKSSGRFKDGTFFFATVCPTIYRIKGEHTLELIKTFSDLEIRENNGERTALQPKEKQRQSLISMYTKGNKPEEDTGDGLVGLARFVNEVERCPACKRPMVLTRSMKGKCYLKCSNKGCKETKFLSKDIANIYITQKRVKCPIHNCALHAGVSKFGIYVKCEMGHFMKPDEI